MASIQRETALDVDADLAWAGLCDFGSAARLFAGVLVDCRRDGDVRTVTFANGMVVNERLVTVDDEARRLVYTVLDGPFSQHSASMQILPKGQGCSFVWISDFLPNEAAQAVEPLVEAGSRAIKANLEIVSALSVR